MDKKRGARRQRIFFASPRLPLNRAARILDSVLAIMKDGSLKVSKVADKIFMGREIIHCAVWPKEGDTNFYTMVYQDGATGKAFAKKFQIGGLSRDKLYPLVKSEKSRVVYLEVSAREKDMPRKVHVSLDGRSGARVREIEFDLTRVPVSTRTSKGLTVTKWSVKEVTAMASPSPLARR